MGHSWRDMDPEGASEHDRLVELQFKLFKQVDSVPLANLTIGDLREVIDVIRPSYKLHSFNDEDAKVLRKIIKKKMK